MMQQINRKNRKIICDLVGTREIDPVEFIVGGTLLREWSSWFICPATVCQSGGSKGGPPLFWVKKEEITEGEKPGQDKQNKSPP